MELPEIPMGSVVEVLGNIVETHMLDPYFVPLGTRINARYDTMIDGQQRVLWATFTSSDERGTATEQLLRFRPLACSHFESEERRILAEKTRELPKEA
ncbi:hypothetical protein [Burkholderia sp. ABCPW 14]|uniref:hypothetical protein n=1 Tax=Burkholderia sp. ABCPW 14 TaxID=1637860 RepID=UPI0012E3C936|nr:hypothetical protein [Burkholderia sp. ABCPW 14]